VKRDNVIDIDDGIDMRHPATSALVQHLERPTPPPSEVRRENRIPRIPSPPPGGTVILHAYRRHSAFVAGVIVAAVAMAAAWWFR
jgi:hypothetical protein